MDKVDVVVIGAGVVGIAIAYTLSKQGKEVLLFDQNESFGQETSSRNSEVIHAGIYYPKGSLKATLCVRGKELLYQYCSENNIPHRRLGKLIVATCLEEEEQLDNILNKAYDNGVDDLQWIDRAQLHKMEPALKATKALLSPSTGIIDSHQYMLSMLRKFEGNDGFFLPRSQVTKIEPLNHGFEIVVESQGEPNRVACAAVINAGGLHAQNVAAMIDGIPAKLVPPIYLCKGNYFSMTGRNPFQKLIYPTPEKSGAGLGIHATIDMAGQLRFGPDTEYIDQIDYSETRKDLSSYYQAIRRYFPGLADGSLSPAYSGIRSKLQAPGGPVQDFVIQDSNIHGIEGLVQLFGIESPGLTASLAIAELVTQKL